jgi:hypothetical protein
MGVDRLDAPLLDGGLPQLLDAAIVAPGRSCMPHAGSPACRRRWMHAQAVARDTAGVTAKRLGSRRTSALSCWFIIKEDKIHTCATRHGTRSAAPRRITGRIGGIGLVRAARDALRRVPVTSRSHQQASAGWCREEPPARLCPSRYAWGLRRPKPAPGMSLCHSVRRAARLSSLCNRLPVQGYRLSKAIDATRPRLSTLESERSGNGTVRDYPKRCSVTRTAGPDDSIMTPKSDCDGRARRLFGGAGLSSGLMLSARRTRSWRWEAGGMPQAGR